ncbi:TPA: Eco57I restriction-modification methylase domain-containing protein [Campylobacter jejuni]|uniref:class I SAM-dependent DNA methyltransferase n=1 Tax=Campylobacter jejuni TaxID=197 RepID=UPI00069A259C|nr:class I SAM-dependent DNA methyltransferase [Campylobacter jejuni]HED4762128.1 Eco57I restriction-modification methylase domain-containing protein [Campylobacter jejuni]HED5155864.1 Eco57I restriction-modification methylase domain-containing protein [Campylobacter jejuni]HED5533830.1 Eco57I restriction-modification methylase domain-containing protein [Campylobacter jejuni]HED6985487.1 Eco57I restriction-modification methylase domain-containing protein [Campylobacter jejuni]HEF3780210.1 Eco5
MHFTLLNEKDFFNPYYRKKQIMQNEFDIFNKALMQYLERLESSQSENEDYLVANALSPFLTMLNFKTHIKTKQKGKSEIDLSISKDEFSKDLEVLIEAKKPNSKEFITHTKVNSKALHETILYYFRNREYSFSLKFIIITDFYKFYIFKISEFEELFYKNPSFKKLFEEFCNPNSLFKGNTEEFYKEVAKLIENSKENLKGFLIDLTFLKDKQKSNFKNLASIYKIFHKDFLLSEFNPNDANSLNNAFYKELLYILGLYESKQNSKLIIAKSEESKEEQGTFYTAINSKLKEENFETILKLLILWLNRILFLKLIESNLVRFNDDKNLKFLNFKKIPDFDKLSELFFEVLAKEKSTRKKSEFAYLPYLNSSLFEKQSIENTLEISSLSNDLKLFYYKNTVLKDDKCKAKKGQVGLLEYLFEFLDSFDFGSDDEQSEILSQKELISSSVLGNVFEKLNGYKEGSFYTPSFITSYMCKESITKVVLDKFNAQFDLDAKDISELRKSLRKEDKKAQKELLNSIKICDPAVGSGHFLVSALNVMLSIYDELNLFDEEFYLEVQNDEILITNHKGEFIEYKRPSTPKDKAHLIQQELFHTKKDIIENNLFGVDINPNSCEITKLRLWIELLKHSFYQSFDDENYHDLKTLPNIDINIKCGNSLVSYFETGKSLSHYPNIKERMSKYKRIVKDYKEGFYTDKNLIAKEIKNLQESFKNFCLKDKFNKEIKQLTNGANEYSKKYGDFLADEHHDEKFKSFFSKNMFEFSFDEKVAIKEFANLKKEYDNIFNLESNHPFEWRFEFPEILDDDGNFKGFDLIIGNPPYIRQEELKELKPHLAKNYKVYKGTSDIYTYFYELGFNVLKENGILSFITSNKYTRAGYGEALREFLLKNTYILKYIDLNGIKVFDSATVDTSILCFEKSKSKDNKFKYLALSNEILKTCAYNIGLYKDFAEFSQNSLSKESFTFSDENTSALKAKIERIGTPLKEWQGLNIYRGILTGYNEAFIITTEKRNEILANCKDEAEKERTAKLIRKMLRGRDIKRYSYEWAGLWVIFIPWHFPNVEKPKTMLENEQDLKEQYLSLYKHLLSHKERLSKRNKEETGIRYEWYCLQRWGANYYQEFEREKIVYPCIMAKEPCFSYETSFAFAMAPANIITSNSDILKYILAFLNSDFIYLMLIKFYMGGGIEGELKTNNLEKLSIPKINSKNEKLADELINLVDEILKAKEQDKNANTQELENKINSIVYKLYNLTEEEIKIIENKE